MRIKAVNKERVFAACEVMDTTFDNVIEKVVCHTIKCRIDQVVGFNLRRSPPVGYIVKEIVDAQVLLFDKAK